MFAREARGMLTKCGHNVKIVRQQTSSNLANDLVTRLRTVPPNALARQSRNPARNLETQITTDDKQTDLILTTTILNHLTDFTKTLQKQREPSPHVTNIAANDPHVADDDRGRKDSGLKELRLSRTPAYGRVHVGRHKNCSSVPFVYERVSGCVGLLDCVLRCAAPTRAACLQL